MNERPNRVLKNLPEYARTLKKADKIGGPNGR
jgi:hypothetical protein